MIWLNIGLSRKLTKIRTTLVSVSHPKTATAFPKTFFFLCCAPSSFFKLKIKRCKNRDDKRIAEIKY